MGSDNGLQECSLALVAVMPTPKDLEIARVLGWYRIPFRMAPKMLDVDYLLFYQTGKYPVGHTSRIEYYSEVRGHELTTRKELFRNEPEHPRANEEYFKIDLGPVTQLPRAITAKNWKRITFFYRLGYLVNQACSIDDLLVKSDERDILWKTIRERGNVEYGNNKMQPPLLSDSDLLKVFDQVFALNANLNQVNF